MDRSRLKGSFPALITPFKNGKVDEQSFKRLIEWQIAEGSNGLVPVGTTGESPTVTTEEHKDLVELCVKTARGRVPVIAGAGSNSTAESIDLARHAKKVGADAVLVVMPYYNKPTQEGMFLHIKAVNDAVDIPIMMYNVPPRTVSDMQPATMARCSELKNVVGVKDATANLGRASLQRIMCKPGFVQFSGEDITALGFNAHGGQGCISVSANVAPRLCSQFQAACQRGDFNTALEFQDRLTPLHDALFCETSPAPVKYAAWKLGIIASPEVRLPLAPASDNARKIVDAALAKVGLAVAKAAE